MTHPASALPAPPRAALLGGGGAVLLLALAWLAGIGRAPPPDPLAAVEPRLAALEARALPDVAPAVARADAALAAAAEA
ncbi:MAG: hypothetical protein N2Z67_07670, partial [Acetobacteraceae bacterium]|nr:hypothetical protein [Acetobacteraceae bacterium]